VARHADDRVRVEDAEVPALVVKTLDLAADDDLSRFARLYGGTVQRLVGAGLNSSSERSANRWSRRFAMARATGPSTRRVRARARNSFLRESCPVQGAWPSPNNAGRSSP
jgi:post-segregation antitoxin (ccd killing protein)